MFDPAVDVSRFVWSAYPELPPMAPWPLFRLADGLDYTSAMEFAVSTLETQAIAGAAVADLLAADRASGRR